MCGSGTGCVGSTGAQCAEPLETHAVGCCADTAVEGFSHVCTGRQVWGERDMHDMACNHEATQPEANAFCRAMGGRLCTQEEMADGCTQGTGCSHDRDMLWTSTEGHAESTGNTRVQGSTDLIKWTTEGNVQRITSATKRPDPLTWGNVSSVDGNYFICLHQTGGGTISTTVEGLQVGVAYSLSWYERDRPGYQSKTLTVTAGNTQETYDSIELSALHTVPDEWTQVSAVFAATASSMVLRFHDPGSSADGSVFLDAIRLHSGVCALNAVVRAVSFEFY